MPQGANPFQRATQAQSKLRLALDGPSGAGKTYTALILASALGERVALIDTERGSASKYAGEFTFDTVQLESFSPQQYTAMIAAAGAAGYDVLIVDSLSHAWSGQGGVLEMVDNAKLRSNSMNGFTAWKDVNPHHNAMVDAILKSPCHVIVTMRSKMEYVLEKNEATGKTEPRKIGLAPVQRDGLEYEFDVVADMNLDNTMVVSKSRCKALSGAVIRKPGPEVAATLRAWLSSGEAAAAPDEPTPAPSFARAEEAPAETPGATADPVSEEQRHSWDTMIAEAQERGLDLAPFALNLDEYTRETIKPVATRLRDALKAQRLADARAAQDGAVQKGGNRTQTPLGV